MEKRIPLETGYELIVYDSNNQKKIIIDDLLGMGGTCLVYRAHDYDNLGNPIYFVLKECYPYKLKICRRDGLLEVDNKRDEEEFHRAKSIVKEAYKRNILLYSEQKNTVQNPQNIYSANNTVYVRTVSLDGSPIDAHSFQSVKDALSIVKAVAVIIGKIHAEGFLYLDIKPENVLVIKETPEIVQLLDFGSMIPISDIECIGDYQISYSMGFAPVEQMQCDYTCLGKWSDIFSIGALLYYLLFGRAPGSLACSVVAEYNFDNSIYDFSELPDSLQIIIRKLLRNTLPSNYMERYTDVSAVITDLDDALRCANPDEMFVKSSYLDEHVDVIGRQHEKEEIITWLHGDKKGLYIEGMGGIGKSTLLKSCLVEVEKDMHQAIAYLNFDESVLDTVVSNQLYINNISEKSSRETKEEYFGRKISALKKLSNKQEIIIVIDNYNGVMDVYTQQLLNSGCRLIMVSRDACVLSGFEVLKLGAFCEFEDCITLFTNCLGRKLEESERLFVERIVQYTMRHTLAIEMIAKQIYASHITISDAAKLVEEKGIMKIGDEDIPVLSQYSSVKSIIAGLFALDTMPEGQKQALKDLSLFGTALIRLEDFKEYTRSENYNDINALVKQNWITADGDNISLHPLIFEVVCNTKWEKEDYERAEQLLINVFEYAKYECDKRDYSKKWDAHNKSVKEDLLKNPWLLKIYEKREFARGIAGRIWKKRVFQETPLPDKKKIAQIISIAQKLIVGCEKHEYVSESDAYLTLLQYTLRKSPREDDDFIIRKAEFVFSRQHRYDIKYAPLSLQLYDYVIYLLCEQKRFDEAKEKLNTAKTMAERPKNNKAKAMYYDIEAMYFDQLLNGDYSAFYEESNEIITNMMRSIDLSIKYIKKVRKGYEEGVCKQL